MKSKFIVFALLFVSLNSFAETICLSNAKDYNELKDKLPSLFKELPLKLGAAEPGAFYDVYAFVKIHIRGDAIMLSTDSWQGPKGRYKDMVEIKKVCFDLIKNEMKISFNNNSAVFVVIYLGNSVKLPDVTLKKITAAQEKAILDKIREKNGDAPAAPRAGGNQ